MPTLHALLLLAACTAGLAGGAALPSPDTLAQVIATPSPAAQTLLRDLALGTSADDARALLARLGEDGSAEWAMVALAALARAEPEVLRDALGVLPRLGAAVGGADLERVRALTEHRDERVQRAAVRCLGLLGDWGAIPLIIARLAPAAAPAATAAPTVTADPAAPAVAAAPAPPRTTSRLAEEARQALIRLNQGRDLGAQPEPWLRWHARTVDETAARLDTLGERLRSDDSATVVRAIHAARLVPGRRAEVANLLAPLRSHADPAIARLADDTVRGLVAAGPVAIGAALPVLRPPEITVAPLAPPVVALVHRPIAIYALVAVTFGAIGALGLLVFLLRTREAVIRMTQRLVRKTTNLTRALKKKLKRITFSS